MARRGKGKVQEEGSSRTEQVPQTLVAPQQLIDEDLPLNPTLDLESLEIEGSGGEKKKGRGKAKGVPNNHNLEVHIYQGSWVIKAKDVYGCYERSCKRARVDKTEELELKIKNMEEELQQYKAMKDELEQLKATQEEVKQMHELMKVMMSQSNIQLPPTTVDVSPDCPDTGVEHIMHD
ncbi:hypothetical protein QYF36_009924 [Acer negundo]|nr:hypothetical protein QYF36_009924 [Acer negundo]